MGPSATEKNHENDTARKPYVKGLSASPVRSDKHNSRRIRTNRLEDYPVVLLRRDVALLFVWVVAGSHSTYIHVQ